MALIRNFGNNINKDNNDEIKIKQMIAHYFKTKKEPKNYDFYPNHIAVLEKPPTPYSRIIAIIISLSVIIFFTLGIYR